MRKITSSTALVVGLLAAAPAAFAIAAPVGGFAGGNAYNGQIALNDPALHTNITDYKRLDAAAGTDALFGSTSLQDHPALVFNTLEIRLMDSGESVPDKKVNNKDCPTGTDFKVYVSPAALCSKLYGRNNSGFRAQAEPDGDTAWKPMLYMNVGGAWRPYDSDRDGADCGKVIVQKICQ